MTLTAYLEWSDETFRDLFYKGLKDNVKKHMVTYDYPATFQKMVDLASQIDGRINLAVLNRNEEVLNVDDIIESFPLDNELVNSDNGELYDSTEAEEDSSDKKDLAGMREAPLAGAIDRLLQKVEEHGIIAKIPSCQSESEQGIWIPDNQPGLALVTWQAQTD
ncbi:putative retrotransposon gag protein [Neofusicoccum parvum UCRNP2]|uniref:Putative retrotransposon gag protein n=1 Tax=Botryosphaeria parva (strain UCR-NP2) TaxID=1287680 RepID=R1GD70_BOTPV|nr:putative retrotransposon gag protein [Neofusicoccum parvum UCRNP2]